MSLQPYIYNFGGGKIQIKHRLIEEKFGRTKRNLIESLMILVLISHLVVGTWVYSTSGQGWSILAMSIGFVILYAIERKIYKIINQSTETGILFLNDDHLIISKDSEIKIFYRDIKSIYFKMNLKSNRQGGRNKTRNAMQAHSYFFQINTNTQQYVAQVENDLWLTEEDKMQFNRGYPLLMYTLEEIHRLYRIPMEEKPRKFHFEAL